MPWEAGDSGQKLNEALEGFITTWLAHPDYKPRLPRKKFWDILKQGQNQRPGIHIVIVTQADPQYLWPYPEIIDGVKTGKQVIEETHMIVLAVKADEKTGGLDAITPIVSLLKCLFSAPDGSPERNDLISRGIYNVFMEPDEVAVGKGTEALDSEEDTSLRQDLNLSCTTDMYTK